MPSKPNRKTKLTNQLRINSKALFDPYLKEKKMIIIEYQDTNEEPSRFRNMEEMTIHTLKEMPIGETIKKSNMGPRSGIKHVDLETEYTIGLDPENDL